MARRQNEWVDKTRLVLKPAKEEEVPNGDAAEDGKTEEKNPDEPEAKVTHAGCQTHSAKLSPPKSMPFKHWRLIFFFLFVLNHHCSQLLDRKHILSYDF